MRSSVSLGLVPWRSFAWKSFPALTRLFVQNHKERHTHPQTCPPVLCFWHTQVPIVRVMLGCKKILANQNNYLSMTKLHNNIKIASKLPHHSPLQLQTHKYQSQRWVTNFPKGDSRSQRIIDSEATHAHVGDAVPHTTLKHINLLHFQHHNIANKATIVLNIHTPNH